MISEKTLTEWVASHKARESECALVVHALMSLCVGVDRLDKEELIEKLTAIKDDRTKRKEENEKAYNYYNQALRYKGNPMIGGVDDEKEYWEGDH